MTKVMKVSWKHINTDGVFSNIYSQCHFCERKSLEHEYAYNSLLELGHGFYYCPFCSRHRFTHKRKSHILLLDFRGIIGWYWNQLCQKDKKMHISDVFEYIRMHQIIGLRNPVMSYDHEQLLWFIDFTRIGSTPHKVSIENVINTVEEMIDWFELTKNIKSFKVDVIKKKYVEAVKEFYTNRKRPEGRRILSPTLKECILSQPHNFKWEDTKNFTISSWDYNIIPLGNTSVQAIEMFCSDLSSPAIDKMPVTITKTGTKNQNGEDLVIGTINLPGVQGFVNDDKENTMFTRKELGKHIRKLGKLLGLTPEFTEAKEKQTEAVPTS